VGDAGVGNYPFYVGFYDSYEGAKEGGDDAKDSQAMEERRDKRGII
jgi:hypothetical protein